MLVFSFKHQNVITDNLHLLQYYKYYNITNLVKLSIFLGLCLETDIYRIILKLFKILQSM